jgi:hypothetical protein
VALRWQAPISQTNTDEATPTQGESGADFQEAFLSTNYAEYFENASGHGVLATADSEGKVNVALYARPQAVGDDTVAFIMRDRLTHANLQSNPHAAYLFFEDGSKGYKGLRLYLSKVSEEKDTERLHALRRRSHGEPVGEKGSLFLVLFKVDKVLPLIGAGV